MLNMLASLVTLVCMVFSVPPDAAPPPAGLSPPAVAVALVKLDPGVVWSEVDRDGLISLLFDDGSAVTMKLAADGGVSTSAADAAILRAPPQGPVGNAPTPSITTSYKDEDGMTHTITTPIVSTTEAGLDAAMQTHRKLVRLMKGIYPPAPAGP